MLFNDDFPAFKQYHFRDLLFREVSSLFEWEGLEHIIPTDILEQTLINQGNVMLFKDGDRFLALNSRLTGLDFYGRPKKASVNVTATDEHLNVEKYIYYSDVGLIEGLDQCVVIENMTGGESLRNLIEFYSSRLAMLWTTMDTNILWQNLPPIYSTADKDVKLSLMKILDDIWTGKPLIVADKALQLGENSIQVGLAEVPFLFNDLHKAHDQILNDFRAIVGINTAGTTKESGIGEKELTANSQSIQTCLQVMLKTRLKACRAIKELFGLDVNIKVIGQEVTNGDSNDGAEEDSKRSEL